MPTATRVAGFWAWKNLGRSVNAGAKGIRILAPIVGIRRKKDQEAEKDITKQNERVLVGFRNAYVFDISQTNGVDLPAMHEVSGDPGENIERLLAAIGSAVPVRLLKRDLLFIIEKLIGTMEEQRIEMLARQHGIRQKRDDGGVKKTITAFVRRADEGTLSRMLVESSILIAASRGNAPTILKEAATAYKVDTDAIAAKVKQEFAAKTKAKKAPQPAAKTVKKAA